MATNNVVNEPTAASGKVLQGQGVGNPSNFSTATYPSTATGTGTLLRADGTNWTATTSTYPNTNAINTLLYASSANVMAALPTANNGVLLTDGSGVPSIGTATVPVGGTGNTTFTAYSVITAGTTATGAFQNVSGVGTSGQVLTSNGASALPTWQNASNPSPSSTVTMYEEFFADNGQSTATNLVIGNNAWEYFSSGGSVGAQWLNANTVDSAHPGVLTNTANSSSPASALYSILILGGENQKGMTVGGGAITINWVFNIVTQSNSTNRYTLTAGFFDTPSLSNGFVFQYNDNINSGNWTLSAIKGGVSTTTNSSTAASTGWHNAQISIDAAGTTATFTMDGVSLGTVSSGFPTLGFKPAFKVIRNLGTIAANSYQVDACWMTQTLTNAR